MAASLFYLKCRGEDPKRLVRWDGAFKGANYFAPGFPSSEILGLKPRRSRLALR